LVTGRPHWLGSDDRGGPQWPDGVHGSISHTDELALCVATRAADDGPGAGLRLGLDLEPVASAPGLHAAHRYVCTSTESEQVAASSDPVLAVLRLFCAKEAIYKALPPGQQEGLGFRSVGLAWAEPGSAEEPTDLTAVEGPVTGARATCAVIGTHVVAAAALEQPQAAPDCGRPGSWRSLTDRYRSSQDGQQP
jgi:4'-phosphopantetheinyl transferase EntD